MKFEITLHATIEYTPVPGDYGTDDPLEMLNIDIAGYKDSPGLIFLDDNLDISVSGQVIEE